MAMQYIGARYVPIVYKNPNDGSANWKANVFYEALTIVVEDNGDSYTSRKAVPASVGKPSENPEYWVKTGDFNASLLAIQNKIGNTPMSTESQTLTGAITEINNKIKVFSEYEGNNDTQKLQNACDSLINGGVILINKLINLNDDIDIKINTNRGVLIFLGINNEAGFQMNGHKFYSTGSTRSFGGGTFSNLRFVGNGNDDGSDRTVIFDCDSLIRITLDSCFFENCGIIFKSTTYMQQTKIINTVFAHCRKIIDTVDIFQFSMLNSAIEDCYTSCIDISDRAMAFVVEGCTIEGIYGTFMSLVRANGVTINGNYFEDFRDNTYAFINLNALTSGSVEITNNYVYTTTAKIFTLLVNGSSRNVIIKNNVAGNECTLVKLMGANGVARYLVISGNYGFTTIVDETDAPNSTPIDMSGNSGGCSWYLGQSIEVIVSFTKPSGTATLPFNVNNHNVNLSAVRCDGTYYDVTKFTVTEINQILGQIYCSDDDILEAIGNKACRLTLTLT